jgi:tetratricopeptide (TPR) repeat protein
LNEAVRRLQGFVERFRNAQDSSGIHALTLTKTTLGRIYSEQGMLNPAIALIEEAVRGWERLVTAEEASAAAAEMREQDLSAALNDLAIAYRKAGRLRDAIETANKSLSLSRKLKVANGVAASLTTIGQTYTDAGYHQEALVALNEALQLACQGGNKDHEAAILQAKAELAQNMGHRGEAGDCAKRALRLFQEMNDPRGVFGLSALLGTIEQQSGRFREARAWYDRCAEIARNQNDKARMGIASHNQGSALKRIAVDALEQGKKDEAQAYFRLALDALKQALTLRTELGDEALLATDHGELSQVYLFTGDLNLGEEHAQNACRIREKVGSTEVYKNYHVLAGIARARGDVARAAEWEHKRDAILAELQRRAQGQR